MNLRKKKIDKEMDSNHSQKHSKLRGRGAAQVQAKPAHSGPGPAHQHFPTGRAAHTSIVLCIIFFLKITNKNCFTVPDPSSVSATLF